MSNVKSCPLCGDNGFIKVSTRRKPSGEWDARMKCCECGIELICSGATEADALTAVLVRWNERPGREIGISEFQKITRANYLTAKRILESLADAGVKVVKS